MMTLVLATTATTLSACSLEKPKQRQPSSSPAKPAAPAPGEVILPSPVQPPAEVQPAHKDPGDRVAPASPPPPPAPRPPKP